MNKSQKYLASDVIDRIKLDFKESEREEVISILEKTLYTYSNVGAMDQAVRSIVYMADGNIKIIKDYCIPHLKYDPRDIIIEAEEKAGNPGHWFSIPFDEMANFSGELPEGEEHEDDGLPF